MGRQKVRVDQVVVPADTPDGYAPVVVAGELAYGLPPGGGGGASALDDLTDVDVSTLPPLDGDSIYFDESSGEWRAGSPGNVMEYSASTTVKTAEIVRNVTSGGSYAAQTWSLGFQRDVTLDYLECDFFQADTYALLIDGVSVASATAAAGSTNVRLTPASPVDLAVGTHQFKIAGTAARRFYFRNPKVITGTGANEIVTWTNWAEASSTDFVAAEIGFRVHTLTPVQFPTVLSSLPAASSSYRGRLVFINGGAGVADIIYVCRKNSADTYEWAALL